MPVHIQTPETFPLLEKSDPPHTSEIDTYLGRETKPKRSEMSVAVARVKPGVSLLEHYHNSTEETFLVLSGHCSAVVDGVTYDLPKGACIVVTAGEKHYLKNDNGSAAEVVCISVPSHDDADFIPVRTED